MKKPFKYYAEFALIPVLFILLILHGIKEAFIDTIKHTREHIDYYNRERYTDKELIERMTCLAQKRD